MLTAAEFHFLAAVKLGRINRVSPEAPPEEAESLSAKGYLMICKGDGCWYYTLTNKGEDQCQKCAKESN